MIQTSSSWEECKYLQRGLYFNGLAEHGDQSRNIVINILVRDVSMGIIRLLSPV